jgi:hypothetical protein
MISTNDKWLSLSKTKSLPVSAINGVRTRLGTRNPEDAGVSLRRDLGAGAEERCNRPTGRENSGTNRQGRALVEAQRTRTNRAFNCDRPLEAPTTDAPW